MFCVHNKHTNRLTQYVIKQGEGGEYFSVEELLTSMFDKVVEQNFFMEGIIHG